MELQQTNLALLPYKSNIIIKDITQKISAIELMKTLLQKFEQALSCFKQHKLHQFDAQVGETLCQIRAYKIYCLATYSAPKFSEYLQGLMIQISDGVKQLSIQEQHYKQLLKIHKNHRPDSVRAPISLADFFSALNCIIPISIDALFLFTSYFLCHYHVLDKDHIPMALDFMMISNELSLSRSLAKKIGHFYQKKLSELSCHFIFQLITELPESQELESILPLLHRESDEGRMVLPCYCVTEIIVLHMIEHQAKLILLIDSIGENERIRTPVLLQGSKKRADFELITKTPPKDWPCMVMYGSHVYEQEISVQDKIEKMRSLGIKKVILSNNAAHPQYSGSTLSTYRYNHYTTLDSEQGHSLSIKELTIVQKRSALLIKMKQLAQKTGCSYENQSLFLLKHIYCHTVHAYKKPALFESLITTKYIHNELQIDTIS